jgi:hypothetical protein
MSFFLPKEEGATYIDPTTPRIKRCGLTIAMMQESRCGENYEE